MSPWWRRQKRQALAHPKCANVVAFCAISPNRRPSGSFADQFFGNGAAGRRDASLLGGAEDVDDRPEIVFDDAPALLTELSSLRSTYRCFVNNMAEFGMGRPPLTQGDWLKFATDDFIDEGSSFEDLVRVIALSVQLARSKVVQNVARQLADSARDQVRREPHRRAGLSCGARRRWALQPGLVRSGAHSHRRLPPGDGGLRHRLGHSIAMGGCSPST